MSPGIQLNILIAEKVFGHKVVHKTWNKDKCHSYTIGEPDYYDSYGESILFNPLPDYSDDIASAWLVLEKLKEKFTRMDLTYNNGKWLVTVSGKFGFMSDGHDTAPMAICMCALEALQEP